MKHTRWEPNTGAQSPLTRAARLGTLAFLAATTTLATPALAAVSPPSAPNLTDGSDSGRSFTDNITKVTQPLFSGTGIPFSALTLYSDSTAVGYAIVPPSGQWTIAPNSKLSDGIHIMTVRQTSGGGQSAPSPSLSIVIDTLAPVAPSRADLSTESDTGSSDMDNITNTTTPSFEGTATPGTFISLYNTTLSRVNPIGKGTVSSQGTWKATGQVPPSPGKTSYFIQARASDAAGNASSMSDVLAVFIDTEKPASASRPDLISADDSGVSHSDNVTNVTTPTFLVRTEPHGKVVLWGLQTSKELIGMAFANSSGYATIKAVKPLNNNYSVIVDGYDLAGNEASSPSPTLNLHVDTVAPDMPHTPALSSKSDTGDLGDGITNLNTPELGAFSFNVGDTINVSFIQGDTTYSAKTQVQSTHLWAASPPPLPDGMYDVLATQSDLAGNTSPAAYCQLIIDTTAPPTPSTPDLPSDADTGSSDSDDITNIPALSFQGSCKSTGSITLYNNNVPIASRETGPDSWFLQVPGLKPGTYHISARAFDAAGNSSAMSPQLTVLLDYTQPSVVLTNPFAPVVKNLNSLAGMAQDSTVNGDFSGMDTVFVGVRGPQGFWSGSAWGGDNNELPATFTNGLWSKTTGLPTVGPNVSTQIQDGDYQVLMFAHDKAGNVKSSYVNVTIDNTAPLVNIVAPIPNSLLQTITDIHGTAEDAVSVSSVKVTLQRKRNNTVYYWNGSAFTTTPATINATSIGFGHKYINWDCNAQLPTAASLDSGLYTVSATAYDAVGNSKVSTQSFSLSGGNASPATGFSNSAGAS